MIDSKLKYRKKINERKDYAVFHTDVVLEDGMIYLKYMRNCGDYLHVEEMTPDQARNLIKTLKYVLENDNA